MSYDREKILREMKDRRRDFHRYPETGWTEYRTLSKVVDVLTELGWAITFGDEFIKPEDVMGRKIDENAEKQRAVEQGANPETLSRIGSYTAIYADLDTGRAGPFTALRFDMDCVDVNEATDDGHFPAREGFASVNPGRMHSCGHDGHTTVGLALAEILKSEEAELRGKIRLVFQPAEEGVRGGYAMSRAGIVDGADYFVAMHLGLGKPTGEVFGGVNGFLCTTKIDVDYRGFSAHAGAEPEKGRNAMLAAATAALNLHAISPHSGGATRINVGVLNAGEGRNVTAPNAHMKIETRGETNEIADYVYNRAVQVLEGAAVMQDVDVSIEKQGEANTANSTPELAALVLEAASGVEDVTSAGHSRPMTGSDDACWFMKVVQDGGGQATYVGIGADTMAGHHNARFDFDEAAMPIALDVLTETVKKLNG